MSTPTTTADAVTTTCQPLPGGPRRPRPQVMSVTPAAAERVKALIDKRGKPTVGIRIGVRRQGLLRLVLHAGIRRAAARPMDEVVETEGVRS